MSNECEYDPINKTAKYEGQPCHHNATTSLAAYVRDYNKPNSKTPGGLSAGNWHMCDCCAALPQFKRRKKDRWRNEVSNCNVDS